MQNDLGSKRGNTDFNGIVSILFLFSPLSFFFCSKRPLQRAHDLERKVNVIKKYGVGNRMPQGVGSSFFFPLPPLHLVLLVA